MEIDLDDPLGLATCKARLTSLKKKVDNANEALVKFVEARRLMSAEDAEKYKHECAALLEKRDKLVKETNALQAALWIHEARQLVKTL